MACKKRKQYQPDYYASMNGYHETFATIYDSMLKSKQFIELNTLAKYVFVCCRNQLTNNESRKCLYKHGQENNITYPDSCFVFPSCQMKQYGLTRQSCSRSLNELIDKGFIEKYEYNKYIWKVNVYRFSTRWKDMETN